MESPIMPASSLLRFFIGFSVFLSLVHCSLEQGFASEEGKIHLLDQPTHHTVELNSLLPATTCSPSTKGQDHKKQASSVLLKVVHKHGPCFEPNQHKTKTQATTDHHEYHTTAQTLQQDQARVDSIHSRLNFSDNYRTDATTLPAKSGVLLGSPNYLVTVGLGTPAKQLSLIFDTGSDLTWVQCRPCARSCYQQKEPIFDPSLSTSYANISCEAAACSQLTSSGLKRDCSAATCIYGTMYGDGSFSVGLFGNEKLTLSSDVFNGFVFGCGQNNQGLFPGSAGLLGLGRNLISLVEQTAKKYNRVFSYCLPSTSSSTGYLSFGNGASAGNGVKFTPLTTLKKSTNFYGLGLAGINVGGRQLSISTSIFSNSGTIIDSGTVITRLPASAYTALRGAFREALKSYPLSNKTLAPLDTCYDFSGAKTVSFPKIGFVFGNGVMVEVDASGILLPVGGSQFCLAFAGNKDDSDIGIIGNVQQKRLKVVYDVAGRKFPTVSFVGGFSDATSYLLGFYFFSSATKVLTANGSKFLQFYLVVNFMNDKR